LGDLGHGDVGCEGKGGDGEFIRVSHIENDGECALFLALGNFFHGDLGDGGHGVGSSFEFRNSL
jgi:hypothetical protein